VSPITATTLAPTAGTLGADVMVWNARRESKRLEDKVRRVRREFVAERAEHEVE